MDQALAKACEIAARSAIGLLRKSQQSRELRREAIINRRHILTHVWKHPHDNPDLLQKEASVTVLRIKGWDGNLKDLADKAQDIYKHRLQGKELSNLDMNEPIRFSQEGKTESFGGIKHVYDAEIVFALGRVVRRAIHVNTEPPKYKKEKTKAMHILVAPLEVNGQLLTVKLTIREAKHSGKGESKFKFYDVAVLKMPVRSIGIGVATSEDEASPTAHEHTGTVSVADMVSVFKGDNERHFPKSTTLKSNKTPAQNDEIRKAHVAAYDRVTKTGALAHIAAHEDSRVRKYEIKLGRTQNSYELHKLRQERFAHLPHWGSLDEHSRQAILDAEDEKHAEHKKFEEWKEKTHGKGKPKADKIDRSSWSQERMFKAMRAGIFLLRKSQMGLFDTHHIAYTRTNKYGTVSNIKAKGTPRQEQEQQSIDFNTPLPEPEKPRLTLSSEVTHTAFMANGKALFDLITGFDLDAHEKKHKEIGGEIQKLLDRYSEISTAYSKEYNSIRDKIKSENPEMERYWEHPELRKVSEEHYKKPEKVDLDKKMVEARKRKEDHNKQLDEVRKKILEHFRQGSDKAKCKTFADALCYKDVPAKHKRALAEFIEITGRHTLHTLQAVDVMKKGSRAHASRSGAMNIAENDKADTVWHEAAHHLEFGNREIRTVAREFRTEKAARDKRGDIIIEKLNVICKTKKYKDDEIAVKDKFYEPYVGKTYRDGDTEVISMGMQSLASTTDFKNILKKDPAHLHLVIGMLHHINPKEII